MGSNTTNHEFGKPTPGGDTDVWGEILNNETIDKLEERVVITDDIANLASYTPYADAAFVGYDGTRDNVRVYLGDGTAWNAQSFGTEANPVPGTSHFESIQGTSLQYERAGITEGGAKIYQSESQTVSNATFTTVQFGNIDSNYISGSVLTPDPSNNKITIERSGRYTITGIVSFSNPGDGTRLILEVSTGPSNFVSSNTISGADKKTSVIANTVGQIDASTDILLDVYQDSGGAIDTTGIEIEAHLTVGRIG